MKKEPHHWEPPPLGAATFLSPSPPAAEQPIFPQRGSERHGICDRNFTAHRASHTLQQRFARLKNYQLFTNLRIAAHSLLTNPRHAPCNLNHSIAMPENPTLFRLPPFLPRPQFTAITKILSKSPCTTPNSQRHTTNMNTHPLRLRPLAAAILCSLIAPALFAQTATTTPVGFITKTVPAAVGVGSPSSIATSIPLYGTAAFSSAVASVDSATQVTLASAAWTINQFAVVGANGITNPHLLRVKTGTNTGLIFAISSNTTNQLTVILPPSVASLVGVLNVNDSCEVVPANTLGSIFGTGATPPTLTGGATTVAADNVYLFNGTTWVPYYYSTTSSYWKQSGNADRSNTIIYPDDLVFVVRKDVSGPAVLTFMGTVPSTTEKSEIPTGSTAFSNRFPVDMTLGGLGLQNIPGWVAGTTAATSDSVYIFNGTTWVKFYFSSTSNYWKQSGNSDRSGEPILAGSGVFIVRSGALATLTQLLPYTP